MFHSFESEIGNRFCIVLINFYGQHWMVRKEIETTNAYTHFFSSSLHICPLRVCVCVRSTENCECENLYVRNVWLYKSDERKRLSAMQHIWWKKSRINNITGSSSNVQTTDIGSTHTVRMSAQHTHAHTNTEKQQWQQQRQHSSSSNGKKATK